MHIDAAYAGNACICPEFRPLLNGVEYADSFNFNPHKWLLVNFDCSALWVKQREDLIDALSVTPEYLRNKATQSGAVIDYRDWQIPLGRRFRSLKLWFVLRTYGVEALQNMIRKHCEIAQKLQEWVIADPRFEISQTRQFALVCFRLKASNEINKALEDHVNEGGRAFISHTVLNDKYIIRFSVGHPSTTLAHVEKTWELIKEEAHKLLQVKA